ncbi:MAG: hypothetical protein LQ348_006227 [Seirophora lacunosa]|nr:MAG: hypothetical protein LQ348_006227 [Seirophora lacunosa]
MACTQSQLLKACFKVDLERCHSNGPPHCAPSIACQSRRAQDLTCQHRSSDLSMRMTTIGGKMNERPIGTEWRLLVVKRGDVEDSNAVREQIAAQIRRF